MNGVIEKCTSISSINESLREELCDAWLIMVLDAGWYDLSAISQKIVTEIASNDLQFLKAFFVTLEILELVGSNYTSSKSEAPSSIMRCRSWRKRPPKVNMNVHILS